MFIAVLRPAKVDNRYTAIHSHRTINSAYNAEKKRVVRIGARYARDLDTVHHLRVFAIVIKREHTVIDAIVVNKRDLVSRWSRYTVEIAYGTRASCWRDVWDIDPMMTLCLLICGERSRQSRARVRRNIKLNSIWEPVMLIIR